MTERATRGADTRQAGVFLNAAYGDDTDEPGVPGWAEDTQVNRAIQADAVLRGGIVRVVLGRVIALYCILVLISRKLARYAIRSAPAWPSLALVVMALLLMVFFGTQRELAETVLSEHYALPKASVAITFYTCLGVIAIYGIQLYQGGIARGIHLLVFLAGVLRDFLVATISTNTLLILGRPVLEGMLRLNLSAARDDGVLAALSMLLGIFFARLLPILDAIFKLISSKWSTQRDAVEK